MVNGWGSLLLDYATPAYDVYCRGFSGYTTRSALSLLPRVFPAIPHTSIITIFWGANDSSRGSCVVASVLLTSPDNTYP